MPMMRFLCLLSLAMGLGLSAAHEVTAQQDAAMVLYEEFRRHFDALPELPEEIENCKTRPISQPFLHAAERLFAYRWLSGDEDIELQQTLDWLELAAVRDCEEIYGYTAGRNTEGWWTRGNPPEIDSIEPTRAADFVPIEEMEAARNRISSLEVALAEANNALADARQAIRENQSGSDRRVAELERDLQEARAAAAALAEESARLRTSGFAATDRGGCWFGSATNGAELHHGWLCLFDGEVQGPHMQVQGPIATFLAFDARTFALSAWWGHPAFPPEDPLAIRFGPRQRDSDMSGSLTILPDGQIQGRLDFGPRRILDFAGGRAR